MYDKEVIEREEARKEYLGGHFDSNEFEAIVGNNNIVHGVAQNLLEVDYEASNSYDEVVLII